MEEYGADTLRTYVLFMGDYGAAAPWNDSSVKGCKRFLERVAALTDMVSDDAAATAGLESSFHKTIKKVSSDIEETKFNTAIAALMTLLNKIYENGRLSKEQLEIFIKLLSPFAPHLTEEIWAELGHEDFLSISAWPEYDEAKTVDATIEIGVQVCGKLRSTVVIPTGCDQATALEIAKADARVQQFIAGKKIIKEIYVPNKIINIVAK